MEYGWRDCSHHPLDEDYDLSSSQNTKARDLVIDWVLQHADDTVMGCISEINDHLYEGRWSPKWIDGRRISRNVYATTREECEIKLAQLIRESKIELAELKRAQKKASKTAGK